MKLSLVKGYFDMAYFAEKILGLTVKWFHREWLELLRTKDRIVISAATGHGKTQIFGIVYPIWLALYKPKSQSLIIAKSIRTQSSNILETIKTTLETNPYLKMLVPRDKLVSWTKDKLVTSNGSKIFYSSYSVNVRGVHVDYVFADEVATYESTQNFFENVVTRVVAKKGKLAAVSTPDHPNDLLEQLMANPAYYSKEYPAIINGKPIWPERYPLEVLNKIKEEIGVAMFEKNYMLNKRAEFESAVFPVKSIHACFDYNASFTQSLIEGEETYIGVDLAMSTGPKADEDAYVVTSRLKNGKIIIKHGETHRGASIPFKIQRLKELYRIYKPIYIIVDESNIGPAVIKELRDEGIPVIGQPFHPKARHSLLINLKILIDNQKLSIPKDKSSSYFINKLEEQLLSFVKTKSAATGYEHIVSKGQHDDTVMALALACKPYKIAKPFKDYIAASN